MRRLSRRLLMRIWFLHNDEVFATATCMFSFMLMMSFQYEMEWCQAYFGLRYLCLFCIGTQCTIIMSKGPYKWFLSMAYYNGLLLLLIVLVLCFYFSIHFTMKTNQFVWQLFSICFSPLIWNHFIKFKTILSIPCFFTTKISIVY